jgi:hypothetical protein
MQVNTVARSLEKWEAEIPGYLKQSSDTNFRVEVLKLKVCFCCCCKVPNRVHLQHTMKLTTIGNIREVKAMLRRTRIKKALSGSLEES